MHNVYEFHGYFFLALWSCNTRNCVSEWQTESILHFDSIELAKQLTKEQKQIRDHTFTSLKHTNTCDTEKKASTNTHTLFLSLFLVCVSFIRLSYDFSTDVCFFLKNGHVFISLSPEFWIKIARD